MNLMPAFPVLWLCTSCIYSSHNGYVVYIGLNVLVLVGGFTIFAR